MKTLATIAFLLIGASALADQAAVKALQSELHGKNLVCQPTNAAAKKSSVWRGDEGFFSVTVSKNQVEVNDNGGQGYGFGDGYIKDIAMSSHKLYLVAGDDGAQTLQIDFSSIGGDGSLPSGCAMAALVNEPDLGDFSIQTVQCCLQ